MAKNGIYAGMSLWFRFIAAFSLLLLLGTVRAAAASDPRADLAVFADGAPYPGEVRLDDGTAWVAVREFALFADPEAAVLWIPERCAASVRTDGLDLLAAAGSRILEANGRLLWCPDRLYIDRSILYAPLRQIAAAFGFDCTYDGSFPAAVLTRTAPAVLPPSPDEGDDLLWLSRIIEAEAGAEPFEGKLAVGAVILNRVDSEEFPDSVREVIFDSRYGIQFTPAENGTVWNEAGEESVRAARVTLDNPRLWDDIAYFLNPALSSSFWIPRSRPYAFTVGKHEFYR